MPILDLRDLVAFPGGDNSSDTLIGGVHFNLTTLDYWNYTLYSNGTLSNGSWCVLTFEPYTPSLVMTNGTFANVTYCYSPVNPIGARAGIGLGFAVVFALALIMTMVNLTKHGRLHLPAETRFRPIGRRWQWYWAAMVSAIAFISLITNVDVDRYYLPELPIVLTCFFWFLMNMCAMACVWEAVRHWGSWMERQFIDPNPFVYKMDDARARVEFWMPLFFYFWFWIEFFLVVPRNWGAIEMQRYTEQTATVAAPAATDGRFKAAAFCLFVCWLTILFSLRHSIVYYCPRNRGLVNRTIGFVRFTPLRFLVLLPVALCVPLYQALAAWSFAWSPLNVHGLNAAIYAGGYGPALLIILVLGLSGFARPNEDRELLRQRRERGDSVDRELGIVKKPAWWRGNAGGERMRDRIARNVRELGGGKATAQNLERSVAERAAAANAANTTTTTTATGGESVEMSTLHPRPEAHVDERAVAPGDFAGAMALAARYQGNSERRRTAAAAAANQNAMQLAAGLLFPTVTPGLAIEGPDGAAARRMELMQDGPPPPPPYEARRRDATRPAGNERRSSAGTTGSLAGPPQTVRSMLDV